MQKDNLYKTLQAFNRGDRQSIAQLKFLVKHLWAKFHETADPVDKQKWKDKIDEVGVEIEFWEDMEKRFPFASQEKYR